ncbi:MAG: phosphatidate cytidylyltransferase, partial [Oscillospiraceae bacterium]|nr:phosphatidate cytidylyltransferase [Oscillospiraceae bacterium]
MKKRLLTAAVCIPLTILTLILFETFIFNVVIITITLIAIHEALTAFHIPHKNVLFAGFVPVCCLYLFRDYEVIDKLAFPAAFFVLLFVTLFIFKYFEEVKITSVLGVTLFSAMVMFSFYSMIHFKIMFPPKEYGYFGVLLLLIGLAYAWGGDSMAYFVGRKFGKRKMSPKISPHKTVEGAIGGVLGSILLGEEVLFVYYGLEQHFSDAPVRVIK